MTVDEATPEVEVWPDNWQALQVLDGMATQWRVGANGATGLDYTALPVVLRMNAAPRSEWPELFECIRVMEGAALEKIREKK